MAFAVGTLPGTSLVFARLHGSVDLADCLNLLYSLSVDPGRLAEIRVLCDTRDAKVDLGFEDLRTITGFVRAHTSVFEGMRWGMVVSSTLTYGLARSAGLMTGDLPFAYEVFQSLEWAMNWLNVTPAEWAIYRDCASDDRGIKTLKSRSKALPYA